MKKISMRAAALTLALSALVCSMQQSLFAVGGALDGDSPLQQYETNENNEFSYSEEDQQSVPYIIGEDISRRSENEKYFRLSDGSYIKAWYMEPVHYFEANEWKDIDNTLTLSAEGYTNTASEMKVVFSSEINSEELYSVEYKDSTVSFSVYDDYPVAETGDAVLNSEELFYFDDEADILDSGGNATGETENIITADESSTNVSKKVGRADIQNNTLKESVEADTANADTEQIETAEEAESDSIEVSDELPEILTDLAEPQLPDNAGSEPPVQDINVYSRNSEDKLSEEEKSDIADLNIIMTDESSDMDFVRTYNRSIILKDNNSTEANLILNAAQSTVDAVNR